MFTRKSFRKLKHKTKKGVMKRIGMTMSRPEDPNFKDLLAILSQVKMELKETYYTSRKVAASGKQFQQELENFCGLGLRSEQVFFKEAEFMNSFGELICTALEKIAVKDIDTLNDHIAQYKTAKLRFDAAYFQTVKRIRKLPGGSLDPEKEADVMGSNKDLPMLLVVYNNSKDMVWDLRNVIISHLKNKVGESLVELKKVSGAQHHQLCCQYFAKRLMQIVELCADETSNEESALLTATLAHKGTHPERAQSISSQASSLASSLESATGAQFVVSKKTGNNVMKNEAIIFPAGNSVRAEDKEEKSDSAKSLSVAQEAALLGETVVDKALQYPESNRTTSPYQVVDAQRSSGDEVFDVGVVG